jgi:hypothetical protein
MDKLPEIEVPVDAPPETQQEESFNHLAERFQEQEPKRRLPLVPSTGNPITQQDIDDVLEANYGAVRCRDIIHPTELSLRR